MRILIAVLMGFMIFIAGYSVEPYSTEGLLNGFCMVLFSLVGCLLFGRWLKA